MSDEQGHGTDGVLVALPGVRQVLDFQRAEVVSTLLHTLWSGAWYPTDTLVARAGPFVDRQRAWRKAVAQRERMRHRRGGQADQDMHATADDDAAVRTGRRMIVTHDLEGLRRRGLAESYDKVDDYGATQRMWRLAEGAKAVLIARVMLGETYREGKSPADVVAALRVLLDRPEEQL